MMTSMGVYVILNLNTMKPYVGSSINLQRRKEEHFDSLKDGSHYNLHLQRAYNKYGKRSFVFGIVECCSSKESLIEREQYWIDKLDASVVGYNILPTAHSFLGYKRSEETKEKMRKARFGKPGYMLGKRHSAATKEKMRQAGLGHPGYMLGKHHTEETKEKMRKPKPSIAKRKEQKALELANETDEMKKQRIDEEIKKLRLSAIIEKEEEISAACIEKRIRKYKTEYLLNLYRQFVFSKIKFCDVINLMKIKGVPVYFAEFFQ